MANIVVPAAVAKRPTITLKPNGKEPGDFGLAEADHA
jgi:hypothetical protein